MRKETKMHFSAILITGLVIIGGLTVITSSAPTEAELTSGVVATTPTSKHLNTSVSMLGFTNQTTSVETSAESNATSSTSSSVHSTSTPTGITSKPNAADSSTTTPSIIVTVTHTLKTESTKAVTTSGNITTSTLYTTKQMASTSNVFMSSTGKPSTRQHKITAGQHKKDPEALSSGSVAAIVIGFIAIVIILFGGAYYFKMRRSSYGRLLDDTDHSSVGNVFNPMFDG